MFNYFIQTNQLSPEVIAILNPVEIRLLSSGGYLIHMHAHTRIDLGSILLSPWVAYFSYSGSFGFQNSEGLSWNWAYKEEISSDFKSIYALYFDLGELGDNEG